jgi:hypothetical protein
MVMDRPEDQWDDLLQGVGSPDSIRLTRGELLLLDWVLCTGSSLMAGVSDDLMAWHVFRITLWEKMPSLDPDVKRCENFNLPNHPGKGAPETIECQLCRPSLGVMFNIEEVDAKVLLAVVPTTFTWGDGVDCGLSLKLKLSQRLLGTYIDPQIQQDIDDAEVERLAKEKADADKASSEADNQTQSTTDPSAG